MSRSGRLYADGGAVRAGFEGFDPDTPVEGFYRMRMRKGAPMSAIRLWYGQPSDPVTGEPLDRSPRWQASINNIECEWEQVWPRCAREPVSQADHDRIAAEFRTMDSDSAFYDPQRPIGLLRATPPQF